ncbi:HAMP domain-containing sensor histidine kinase [Oceanobacillus bengalensis]|uniref:Signal transduction histidine-protein kinase ArlS n=1 Tax=Oceanobacillus bengalensis TaxID=1435466 RepID=A0A494YSH2_9BACI|nr:HAMP domain-containing histidine kinase [Oceanobacillus bengalensis]RKQ12831.1 sensor histidine kinase [Oceanobacillus bengalensis]
MKLKTKIQAFSSMFMLLLILLVNTSVYFLFNNMTANSELKQLAVQTDDLVNLLKENPEANSGELIKAYLPSDGMIRVIEENGNMLEEKMRLYEYHDLPGEFSTKESQSIVSVKNNPDIAVVTKPIIWNSGTNAGEIVTLQVSNHLIPLHETMQTLFYVLVVLSFVMLIPTIIAGSVLSRFLLSPIKKLIETMKENTKHGKWKTIDVENRSKDELYEMEMTFNEMIDYLKENYEKQEMFVSNASHELKTPIQIVKGYAQLLKRRGVDRPELLHESIEAIDSEADRMKKLVEQMLSLAKNKETVSMENVNLSSLARDTAATFKGAYGREVNVFDAVGTRNIYANRDQLEQVIYILIDNAIKYSNGKVDVYITELNNEVIVEVEDYGNGISEEEQARIFDRFYRVDKARSRDTGGTGLGLAIAKGITEMHQGDLTVRSEVGEGSTFTLKLPVIVED